MEPIKKEIPVGDIDGINTIFTVLNDIDYVDDLWYDGAITTAFTIDPTNSKRLILTNAPETSIWVDYQPKASTVQKDTTVTWGSVKTEIWGNLGQTSASTNFSNSKLDSEMNSLVSDMYRGRVQHVLERDTLYRAGSLWFINGLSKFRYNVPTKLTAELNVGDVVAQMDTVANEMADAGAVWIGGDLIKYTSKTDTQIEGISGQTIKHLETDNVFPVYLMPQEMDKPNFIEFIIKNTESSKLPIPLFKKVNPLRRYYEIIRDGNDQYVKVVGISQNEIVEVDYIKQHSDITDDNTIFPIPNRYGLSVVANIVSGKLGYGKSLPNAKEQLMIGYTNLQSMFANYNNEENVIKQSIKPKNYKYTSIRRNNW